MRIAITSQNFRTITGHAGKTRRFWIFEANDTGAPREIDRIDLPAGMSMHDYHGSDHPLFQLGLDAIVTGSAGPGFLQRMAKQGIRVYPTGETDPRAAAAAVAAGQPLPPAAPHEH